MSVLNKTNKCLALMSVFLLGSATSAFAFTACQVTDTGGIDDNSFNQTAWKGVEDAQAAFGVTARFLESQAETDYEANINALVDGVFDKLARANGHARPAEGGRRER